MRRFFFSVGLLVRGNELGRDEFPPRNSHKFASPFRLNEAAVSYKIVCMLSDIQRCDTNYILHE